ncbi:hypothetical protein [Halomonas sp. PGE1]|uniref:hypothetical protein n=1 Tax=Halomonas sp. PGE1 TaxID=2730360 RepID=UPI0014759DB9|nr:hypothetical protein [Halomonas sp. PGE1]QJQ99373.1 hypothetical protein HIR79_12175 [Halomonas sp. PGE1]
MKHYHDNKKRRFCWKRRFMKTPVMLPLGRQFCRFAAPLCQSSGNPNRHFYRKCHCMESAAMLPPGRKFCRFAALLRRPPGVTESAFLPIMAFHGTRGKSAENAISCFGQSRQPIDF